TKLPTIPEIERLWYEVQREMVESGRVAKFNAEGIQPNGDRGQPGVVRVGDWHLISNGKYLTYEEGKLEELLRQPDGSSAGASDLQNATAGLTGIGLDPTGPSGGSLLKAMINKPSLIEKWHQGGSVGYVITAIGVFGVLLG